MNLITIENIIKPLKKVGRSKATGTVFDNQIEIDLDRLTCAYLGQEIALEAIKGTLGDRGTSLSVLNAVSVAGSFINLSLVYFVARV